MEKALKWSGICFNLFCIQLCNGKPIYSEDTFTGVNDPSQLVTALVVLLTICSLAFIGGCLCCQKRNAPKRFRDTPVVASGAPDFDHGHVNPIANGEFTIFTPLSPHLNNNIFLASEPASRTFENYNNDGIDLNPWFSEHEKDFPRIKLKYIKELGRGWFGKVVQGAAQDIGENGQIWTPVVVRILDATSSQKEKVLFLQDASIYKCGEHPNILKQIGKCLDTVPFLLLQEYCPQGDLKAYLRANKANAGKLLAGEYPLLWCCQLTSALKFLHENKICHPDLAARNCQLTSSLTLKLGDYGLAVFRYPSDYYQSSPGLPLRWCAPESLNCTQTTIQPKSATPESNVWALGVTMWEVYECGEQPYVGLNDDEVIAQVLGPTAMRLDRPKCNVLYTDYIFRLMQLCWATNPEERPTITRIDLMLSDLLQVPKNANNSNVSADSSLSVDDFDRRWETFKPNYIVKTDHLSDTVSVEIHEPCMNTKSASLTKLHGSLDDLLRTKGPPAECFIEDEISHNLMTQVPADTNSISDSDQEEFKSKMKSKPRPASSRIPFVDNFAFNRMSSGSETEEENWRHKVERGAYTEKVRMKSRSVADLMVLTHVDYSESESETPLPSLDYRVNYKNVRLAPASNLESANLTFGSEGNLLEVENTFQEELKKLKEGRRDSLLFVPDSCSHNDSNSIKNEEEATAVNPSDLIHELNDTAEIKPVNQIYNVFKVTIEHSPIHVNKKLNEIIFNDCSQLSFDTMKQDLPKDTCIYENNSCDSNLENISGIAKNELEDKSQLEMSDSENNKENFCAEIKPHLDLVKNSVKHNSQAENELQNVSSESQIELSDNEEDKDNGLAENSCTQFEPHIDLAKDGVQHNTQAEIVSSESQFELSDSKNNKGNGTSKIFCTEFESEIALVKDGEQHETHAGNEFEDVLSESHVELFNSEMNEDNGIVENSSTELESHIDLVRHSVHHDDTHSENKLETVSNESQFELSDSQSNKENSIRILSERLVEEILREAKQEETSIRSLSEKIADEILIYAKHEESSIRTLSGKLVEQILSDAKHTIEQFPKNGKIPKLSEKILNNKMLVEFIDCQKSKVCNSKTCENTLNISSEETKSESQNIEGEHLESLPTVKFDISSNQEQAMPNSLTHSSIFCSTPFKKKDISLPSEDVYTSMTLFGDEHLGENENKELNYSLETWDNFLGKTLDQSENLFDSFSSEPQSLLFIDDKNDTYDVDTVQKKDGEGLDNTREELNGDTFVLDSIISPADVGRSEETFDVVKGVAPREEQASRTFVKDEVESPQANTEDSKDSWESGGGWFLHPQTYNECPSGELQIQPTTSDSYVGFGIDDEIMSAIRNELLSKLPHAQGSSSERVKDDEEEWDTCERNEVFLKYNVYNTPLSPIPEESCTDELSGLHSPKQENADSDWSEQGEDEALPQDTGSISPRTHDSPCKGQLHRHTPSQDSCCSNDTLFNLEELIAVEKEGDNPPKMTQSVEDGRLGDRGDSDSENLNKTDSENANRTYVIEDEKSEESTLNCKMPSETEKPQKCTIEIFLTQERDHSSRLLLEFQEETSNENGIVLLDADERSKSEMTEENERRSFKAQEQSKEENGMLSLEPQEQSKSESTEENGPLFPVGQLVPLPSPEDNPWRQLPASLLTYNTAIAQTTNPFLHDAQPVPESDKDDLEIDESPPESHENLPETNLDSIENEDVRDEREYEDFVNMENAKNSLEYSNLTENNEYIYDRTENDNSDDENIYGILTDIRFNGPSDAQLMSTSFSESNNCDDQEWDSGSESRSSSSGEFIWKEGEHEESLKALTAAPQDTMEDIKPMECITEGANEESDISSTFSDDEDGETPEFVPSAWDKFAMPGKSALRSPEKIPKRSEEKKSKAVWFKKQKYQCVYEYPKEPDSPVSQTTELWKPPSQADYTAFIEDTGMEDEFFISSSARPFDLRNSLSSQFFPGNSGWPDSATPDSGLEDFTPSGVQNEDRFAKCVPSLKQLASDAVNKKKQMEKNRENLGGLRHQKNKLKLDLPPSPSAFTSEKLFTIDPPSLEPVIREKPTFTTFGKSRFHVQHVDTPSDDPDSKNVSFEALPYKPLQEIQLKDNEKEFVRSQKLRRDTQDMERNVIKTENSDICNLKMEIVRGEASLLDSADEDSGIESSTLERKLSAT
ncbi:unnamed protein product [Acanthoscelides obtectus]|uniref:Protein kinase domain-containing protein n=1 Tax=Acanthoscelides obtectus TaxID=200917 RepID=A0A9P0JM59_ACAOB|nr:unnamed protein product [Acanthoscelides obtectus]CAK1634686.1 Serine/threonine-protein kinase LMTK1 [Acanthoscelides obtectus]